MTGKVTSRRTTGESFLCLLLVALLGFFLPTTHGNPHSKPYIPYRTDPYDQPSSKSDFENFKSESSDDHQTNQRSKPRMYVVEKTTEEPNCPLRFSLGVSKRSHGMTPEMGIQQPPIIYPILPWEGPGRQVLFSTQYEHVDLLTPSKGSRQGDTEGLEEHLEFPLLFESSAFQTSPVIADVNDDGILDAILTDYHGGLYAIGLQVGNPNENHKTNHRYFLKAQIPRLYVRRQWVQAMVNETMGIDPYEAEKKAEEEERKKKEVAAKNGDPKDETRYRANDERPHDPYHSYFEYSYGAKSSDHEDILRGVTANVLGQNQEHVQGLEERRNRNLHPPKKEEIVYDSVEQDEKNQKVVFDSAEEEEKNQKVIFDSAEEEEKNQKVIFDSAEEEEKNQKVVYDSAEGEENHRRLQEADASEGDGGSMDGSIDDLMDQWGDFADDLQQGFDDDYALYDVGEEAGDAEDKKDEEEGVYVDGAIDPEDDVFAQLPTDDELKNIDDYHMYNNYDDYYNGRYSDLHDDYFDDEHYMRLPPHVLATPVLAELPKPYTTNGETENLLFLAVSYYYDEDEYEGFFSYKRFENTDHGDETEAKRGLYTANAIMVFHFGQSPRWGEFHRV